MNAAQDLAAAPIHAEIAALTAPASVPASRAAAVATEVPAKGAGGPRRRRLILIAAAAIIVGAALGGYYWAFVAPYESTDDAFVEADVTPISPQVAGRVLRVPVSDNQEVRQGAVLFEIDPSDY